MLKVKSHVMKPKEKLEKMNLNIVLEEGDSVLTSVQNAMVQKNIKEAVVVGVSGKLKTGVIQFMGGGSLKSKEVKDIELIKATGNLKISFKELFGRINVSTKHHGVTSGALMKGTAKEGLTIKLEFSK